MSVAAVTQNAEWDALLLEITRTFWKKQAALQVSLQLNVTQHTTDTRTHRYMLTSTALEMKNRQRICKLKPSMSVSNGLSKCQEGWRLWLSGGSHTTLTPRRPEFTSPEPWDHASAGLSQTWSRVFADIPKTWCVRTGSVRRFSASATKISLCTRRAQHCCRNPKAWQKKSCVMSWGIFCFLFSPN